MAIAEATSLTYSTPQGGARFIEPPAPVEPIAPTKAEAMLPPLNEDLAQVQGLTDSYYDSYGKLKSYVESMNSKGIDVTKPHYGDPAKMELFNTYRMLEANVITTAQQLKEKQRQRKIFDPLEAQGKFVYTQDPTEELGIHGYSTELDPFVKQTNENLAEQPLTRQAAGRQLSRKEEAIDQYDKAIEAIRKKPNLTRKDQTEIERLKYQKNQIAMAYQGDKVFNDSGGPSASQLGFQARVLGATELVKQVTRSIRGVDFNENKVVNGKASRVGYQLQGKKLAPVRTIGDRTGKPGILEKKIDFTYKTSDGRTFIRFAPTQVVDSRDGAIIEEEMITPDDQEITGREPTEFIKELASYNSDYIGDYDELLEAAAYGGVVSQGVTDENVALKGLKPTEVDKDFENKVDTVKAKLKSLSIQGNIVKLKAGNSNIEIRPMVYPSGKRVFDVYIGGQLKSEDNDSIENVEKWLSNNDYMDIIVNSLEPPKTPAVKQPAKKVAQPVKKAAQPVVKKTDTSIYD